MPATNFNLLTNIFASFRVTAPFGGIVAGTIGPFTHTVAVVVENLLIGEEGVAVYKAEKIRLPSESAQAPFFPGAKVYADIMNGVISFDSNGGANIPCGILVHPVEVGDSSCIIDLDGTLGAHSGDYAAGGHDHDFDYAAKVHNHDTAYSAINHDHDLVYSKLDHTH